MKAGTLYILFTAVPPVSRAVPGTLVGAQIDKYQVNAGVGEFCVEGKFAGFLKS